MAPRRHPDDRSRLQELTHCLDASVDAHAAGELEERFVDVVTVSQRIRSRRKPWIQASVRSITQRTVPSPEPCGTPHR